jgi:dihydrofolate reductase
VSQTPLQLVDAIRQKGYNSNWLVGGGALAKSFHDAGLIDEYFISLIPYLLGQGIRLLGEGGNATELKLIDSITHTSGVVQLRYSQ